MKIAAKRFRPEFEIAFEAWQATRPATNPKAPPGPTYMPQYKQPDAALAAELDQKADELYREGQHDASTADDYVRITVYLATVLFLVGISGHFKFRAVRYGLVTIGVIVVILAVGVLTTLPGPPG
jgi:hypothetical protein